MILNKIVYVSGIGPVARVKYRLADRVQTSRFNRKTRNVHRQEESINCAHELCSCPGARVILRKPSPRDKMTRKDRSRLDAFWQ
eukprot:132523-Pyramimonas_sp.AAC.1